MGFEPPTGYKSHSLHPNRCGDFFIQNLCILVMCEETVKNVVEFLLVQ